MSLRTMGRPSARGCSSYYSQIPKHWRFAGGAALCSIIFLYAIWDFFGDQPVPLRKYPLTDVSVDQACHDFSAIQQSPSDPIPNLLHYVWLLKDPDVFEFDFLMFISVYSAYLFWRPEIIYIHTDSTANAYERARTEGSVWTQRTLAIPGVERHAVSAPTVTTHGVALTHFANKADFVRLEVLRDFGGVYIDTDVIPLRDIEPLRTSGFAAVVGEAHGAHMRYQGFINNGILLARRDSLLVRVYLAAAHLHFDGMYNALIKVLSDLASRMAAVGDREVLILHGHAFNPASWERNGAGGQKNLWAPTLQTSGTTPRSSHNYEQHDTFFGEQKPREHEQHNGAAGRAETTDNNNHGICEDAMAWLLRNEDERNSDSHVMDFSGSYTLHSFDPSPMNGWDGEVDLEYVAGRRSNFARAVWPAVRHAIGAGVITDDEARRAGVVL